MGRVNLEWNTQELMEMESRTNLKSLCGPLMLCLFFLISESSQTPPSPSKTSFSIAEHTFRVAAVAFDETAMGFVPPDMGPDEHALFVEFELFSGNKENFKALEIEVSCASDRNIGPVLLTADGVVKMLAAVTVKTTSGFYRPEDHYIAWVFIVPREAEKLQLNFPNGKVLDLSPLLKKGPKGYSMRFSNK